MNFFACIIYYQKNGSENDAVWKLAENNFQDFFLVYMEITIN